MNPSKAQIGRAGEFLVQQKLLLHGIESAPLTTDCGVDLVVFSPISGNAITIQVKSNLVPKPGGGKGKPILDWWVPDDSPADIFAFVDLGTSRVWLVKKSELPQVAQQHPEGRHHFFMATDPTASSRRDGKSLHDYEFQKYLLENIVHTLI
ncbi:MAG: hypothetical protein AB1696_08595 [Planctomycetota bacterium]